MNQTRKVMLASALITVLLLSVILPNAFGAISRTDDNPTYAQIKAKLKEIQDAKDRAKKIDQELKKNAEKNSKSTKENTKSISKEVSVKHQESYKDIAKQIKNAEKVKMDYLKKQQEKKTKELLEKMAKANIGKPKKK